MKGESIMSAQEPGSVPAGRSSWGSPPAAQKRDFAAFQEPLISLRKPLYVVNSHPLSQRKKKKKSVSQTFKDLNLSCFNFKIVQDGLFNPASVCGRCHCRPLMQCNFFNSHLMHAS